MEMKATPVCSWCNQVIKGLVTDRVDPQHPDCFEFGVNLMEVGWTPTRDYEDTPEVRKAMREQFHGDEEGEGPLQEG